MRVKLEVDILMTSPELVDVETTNIVTSLKTIDGFGLMA